MDADNNVVKVRGAEAEWKGAEGGKWGTSVIASTTTKNTKQEASVNLVFLISLKWHTLAQ